VISILQGGGGVPLRGVTLAQKYPATQAGQCKKEGRRRDKARRAEHVEAMHGRKIEKIGECSLTPVGVFYGCGTVLKKIQGGKNVGRSECGKERRGRRKKGRVRCPLET